MLWLNSKIEDIISNINPKDIAFLLASSLEINRQKRSRAKAQIALDCLSSHKSFKSYIFEFYFKEKLSNRLRCVALAGSNGTLRSMYQGRSVGQSSVVHNVFHSKKIRFDAHGEKEIGRRKEFLDKLDIKASLFLPVNDFGVLVVSRTDTKKFTEYEMILFRGFVDDVITTSLELALDNEKNFNAAIRDQLTDVYNHGYFVFQLEREVENARRGKNKISLIMIDIDYFKHYNDMHGHPKGDKVLHSVANILKQHTRRGDVVARYGGEEFAVILFNTKLKTAIEKADELRKAVSNFKFEKEELQPNGDLTISLGVANFPEHANDAKELVVVADKALYFSKHTGRNKVSVYNKVMK